MNYLARIRTAATRFEAADLIRANATSLAASFTCYSHFERLEIVIDAERQAAELVRPLENVAEANHPWKRWLREWGFIPS